MTYHDHRCLLVVMSIELANDHTVVMVLRLWKEFLSTYLYKVGGFIPLLYILCSMAGPEAGQTLKAMLIDMHSQWTPWGKYPSIGSFSLLMIYSKICREAIHPWKLTWIPKKAISKRSHLFQTIFLGIHVSFRGCMACLLIINKNPALFWYV